MCARRTERDVGPTGIGVDRRRALAHAMQDCQIDMVIQKKSTKSMPHAEKYPCVHCRHW
jgi:hypothetical protein